MAWLRGRGRDSWGKISKTKEYARAGVHTSGDSMESPEVCKVLYKISSNGDEKKGSQSAE